MMFFAPLLGSIALEGSGPAENCSLCCWASGRLDARTRIADLKGVAMDVLGLIFGLVGSDLENGAEASDLRLHELADGIALVRPGARPVRHRPGS